jgi:hypothetical protein
VHWVTYSVRGDHIWLHLVLLAALNATVAILIIRIGRHWLPGPMSLALAGVWAMLPNHSATRLWPATAPTMVALILLLIGIELARDDRFAVATAVIAASALAYEGGIAIGAAALVVLALRRGQRRIAVGSVATLGIVALWVWRASPKHDTPTGPFTPGRALAAELGRALVPDALATIAVLIVLGVLVALVLTLSPGFRRPTDAARIGAGLALVALGVAPFVAARFPLSTDGLLDRGNTFASIGTALVLVATGRALLPAARAVRPAALAAGCLVFAVAGAADVGAAHRADDDARRVLVALHHLGPGRYALAPLPNHDGYASFGYDTIGAAAGLELGRSVRISDSLTDAEWRQKKGVHIRLQGNRFVRVSL